MLESNDIQIPDLIFMGWDIPEAIDVYYYEDPETKNKVSSGFSVVYSKSKEDLMTPEFMKNLEELNQDKVILVDNNEEIGALETTYLGLKSSGVDKDEAYITFSFVADKSHTYLKPLF